MDLHNTDFGAGLAAYFFTAYMFCYAFIFLIKLILNVFKNRGSKVIQLNTLSLILWVLPFPMVSYLLLTTSIYEGGLDTLVSLYFLLLLSCQAYFFHLKLKWQEERFTAKT